MQHLIIGRQGSGKTLFLVRQAYKAYREGKNIFSNIALKFPYQKININDIIECKLKNGFVLLDEVHQFLPSRNSMSTRSRLICDGFLSMIRKQNLELYGSTQTERKVDIRFRDETDYLYVCSKEALINKEWVEIMTNQNLDKNIPLKVKLQILETSTNMTKEIWFLGNPFFKLFDTNEIVKIEGM